MNRDPDRRVPPKRTGFDPSRYDPSKYDMYAAFRTKERAEERAAKQAQRRSLYDVSPQKSRPTGSSGQSGVYGRSGTYGNPGNPGNSGGNFSAPRSSSGRPAQNRQTTAQNGSRPTETGVYHINRPPQTQRSGMQPDSRRTQQTQTQRSQTQQTQFRTQDPAQQNAARRTADQTIGKRASAASASASASASLRGTRVNSAAGDSYRYGYHSSYRTSDGRILDGFDKSGRPIYREDSASGNAPIVRTTSAAPDAARLHPVRRIRVETLEDTERKPFPFALVLTVFLCTALVMAVLYTYMTLNECTNNLSTLTYRLSNLRAEVNTLSAEVVRREDLIAIEQTAADELGMVKNDVLEKRYVSIENEDRTEVVKKTAPGVRRRVSVEIDLDTGLPAANPDAAQDGQ